MDDDKRSAFKTAHWQKIIDGIIVTCEKEQWTEEKQTHISKWPHQTIS